MKELDYHSMRNLEILRRQLTRALENQNVAYLGEQRVVRIPDIPGRIRKIPRSGTEGFFSVEYIADEWYDEEAGQSRNEKHIIDLIIDEYPMAMYPIENY